MSISVGWTIFESPIGPLTVVVGSVGVTNIYFPGCHPRLSEEARRSAAIPCRSSPPVIA
jgi:hypothetical protein